MEKPSNAPAPDEYESLEQSYGITRTTPRHTDMVQPRNERGQFVKPLTLQQLLRGK